MGWFEASKSGLEKIARRRGLNYVLFELVQNCWDTGAKDVNVTFTPVEGRPLVDVTVEDDDPEGFKDMSHAWTLFAASAKVNDPTKRGRFNFGEKLVLAICESAEIVSTTGHVRFDSEGRHLGRKRRSAGTIFEGRVRMTREELASVLEAAQALIAPEGTRTLIGGVLVPSRTPLRALRTSLMTEVADDTGSLVRRPREALVKVYEALHRHEDGTPNGYLYEMGIPVCETGDPWDVDVHQKVPVSLERNDVSLAYRRRLGVAVVNAMTEYLTPEIVTSPLVQEALCSPEITGEAVGAILTEQYGEKRAIWDPRDQEANHRLVAEGYKVIHGASLSKEAWAQVRTHGAAVPAGRLSPTPKPYSDSPDAMPRKLIPESAWTDGMKWVAEYAESMGLRLLGHRVNVVFDQGHFGDKWAACYGDRELTWNIATLGREFFNERASRGVNRLLIHEFAHEFSSNHLDREFADALQDLGSKMVELALNKPWVFRNEPEA